MSRVFGILFLLAGLFFASILHAQDEEVVFDLKKIPYNVDKKMIIWEDSVVLQDIPKDVLFERALKTLDKMYPGFKSKVSEIDKTKGRISTFGFSQTMVKNLRTGDQEPAAVIRYRIDIEVREWKYIFHFYDFATDKGLKYPMEKYYLSPDDKEAKKVRAREIFEYLNYEMTNKIQSFKRNMAKDL